MWDTGDSDGEWNLGVAYESGKFGKVDAVKVLVMRGQAVEVELAAGLTCKWYKFVGADIPIDSPAESEEQKLWTATMFFGLWTRRASPTLISMITSPSSELAPGHILSMRTNVVLA